MEFVLWIPIGLVAAAVGIWYVHRAQRRPYRFGFADLALLVAGLAAGVAFGTVARNQPGSVVVTAALSVLFSAGIALSIAGHRGCGPEDSVDPGR
ncbi:MAG: hypothetical protein ACM3S1_15410 [Hyphomicrobiales bacterium]